MLFYFKRLLRFEAGERLQVIAVGLKVARDDETRIRKSNANEEVPFQGHGVDEISFIARILAVFGYRGKTVGLP